MIRITFRDHQGELREVDAQIGDTLMESAIKANVPGIDAECGGACACATCHVYVDPSFLQRTGSAGDMEQSMLDFAENVKSNSRLACQIYMDETLDGLTVSTPESQQ
ncbi:MAG: 2Fe-2S iron-sulfur cluster-binding protein [Pseudomonadota bacterium]